MKFTFIKNWKDAFKMQSFQLMVIAIALEWGHNLAVAMPETPIDWARSIVLLLIPVARLVYQPKLWGAK